MKRHRKVLICMTDAEYDAFDLLVKTYSLDGAVATKSFLVRYALKKLPYQNRDLDSLNPFASGVALESAC